MPRSTYDLETGRPVAHTKIHVVLHELHTHKNTKLPAKLETKGRYRQLVALPTAFSATTDIV